MFSSITSFLSSATSSLPFRVTADEIVHPGQSAATAGAWKHFPAVRVAAGVGGALAQVGATGAVGDPVSVFTFDKRAASSAQVDLARNALIRLKTLRHPNVVKYIDSVDLPTHLHILTEPVTPLAFEPILPGDHVAQLAASLGLHQLATTLSWLNNDAKMVHGNLHPGSLYTNDSGDWKLFGFDLCHKGTEAVPDSIVAGRAILPAQYRAPELVKGLSSGAAATVIHATDAWSLSCVIFQTFNANFSSPQQLVTPQNIPALLVSDYKKLLATTPGNRLNPRSLLEGAFFRNELVGSVTFLDSLAIHSPAERDAFFVRFAENLAKDMFPPKFCRYKILPQLTNSLDYGSGLTCFSAILRSVLRIGAGLSPNEYAAQVLPSVVKLFASNERQIRVHLLQTLGEYAPQLSAELVNEQLFGHVLTGFADANPTLRELTVKSMMHFAAKLSPANLDAALRWMAKLQADPEPAIRTNTGYALAKIASHLPANSSEKVLIPAFLRMLKDTFPPARVAGLSSLAATLELHAARDIARAILPGAAPLLVDDVVDVRAAAGKLCEVCLQKMAQYSAAEKQRQDAIQVAAPNAMGSTQQPAAAAPTDASSAAVAALGSLGSWAVGAAVGAVRNKMSNADAHPPKHLSAGSGVPPAAAVAATNSLLAAKPKSAYASSSSNIAAPAAAAAASGFDDDFFGKDSDSEAAPVAVVALNTKKEKKKTEVKKKDRSSSILSAPAAASPAASSSLDSWNFDLDDQPAAAASVVDDFDSWGSSLEAPTPAPATTKHASKPSFDLLASSTLPAKKPPAAAAAAAADPFASLSLGGATPSPKPASPAAPMSLSAKAKASPLVLSAKSTAATATSTTKKAVVDDWGDFLNS